VRLTQPTIDPGLSVLQHEAERPVADPARQGRTIVGTNNPSKNGKCVAIHLKSSSIRSTCFSFAIPAASLRFGRFCLPGRGFGGNVIMAVPLQNPVCSKDSEQFSAAIK
jgi:hypothetical protein